MNFKKLSEILPPDDHAELGAIEGLKNLDSQPLLLCVAGAFSTGKTSLINRMLEKDILPVALEEATALPTFLEYSEEPSYKLAFEDGVRPIKNDQLEEIIKNPPAGARFLDVGLPLNWLNGLRLVDLPGTGGSDKIKAEYARQQMRNADAIIYLLHPRGPTRQDLENIKLLRALSKSVLLCVSQWDIVQESAKKGEKIPDLQAWQKEIAYNTGLDSKIVTLDKTGLGLSEVFSFLVNSIKSQTELRDNRIYAELIPLLSNRLSERKRALEILQAAGAEEAQELQQKLMAEKEQLLELKKQVFEERQTAISDIMDKWHEAIKELQEKLDEQFKELVQTLHAPADYDKFLNEGRECLNRSLIQAARYGRDISQEYGRLTANFTLPENEQLLLPEPPALEVSDFLDSGRFGALRDELLALKERERQLEEQKDSPQSERNREEILERIKQMEVHRQKIMNQPLPMQTIEREPGGSGKMLGRMIGEMADMALIFFLPATLASKSANLAAKTAKGIGLGAKAAKKIGTMAKYTVKGMQTAHKAAKGENVMAPPIFEKLEILDKLTLGYWGEKLGEILDGPAEPEQIVDLEALNERNAALGNVETELQKMRLELLSLPAFRKNDPGLRDELLERIAQKEKQLERMQKEAAEAKNAAEEKARQEYHKKFVFAAQRAATRWLRSFEKQTDGMGQLLRELLKNWWEERIPQLLESQETKINDLLVKIQEDPARRNQEEEKIQNNLAQLEEALAKVRQAAHAES